VDVHFLHQPAYAFPADIYLVLFLHQSGELSGPHVRILGMPEVYSPHEKLVVNQKQTVLFVIRARFILIVIVNFVVCVAVRFDFVNDVLHCPICRRTWD